MRKILYIATVIVITARVCYSSDIYSAVRSNDVGRISQILDTNGPDAINAASMGGITPLHIAAAMNNKKMVGFLVSAGAKVNAKTDKGFTPLHWAASKDAKDSAEILIAMGADINAQTDTGITPLHWAANKDSTNVVELLILSGANINLMTEIGQKPLHWAVKKDAATSYNMLLFRTVTEEEADGSLKIEKKENIDNTDWNKLVEDNASTANPVIIQGHPRAKLGEPLTLPIGQDIDLAFVWIEQLGIWMGKYEITNEQYRRYKPEHSSFFREEFSLNGNSQPAVFVSWKQAKIYCTWLNRNFSNYLPTGFKYRLPTDSEWISCARRGDDRIYPWGNAMPPKYGNFSDDAARKHLAEWKGIKNYNDGFAVTCDVARSGTNEEGIFGLAGNVWEWCEDWYNSACKYKILHGGSWDYDEEPMLRIDTQGFDRPDTRDDTIGFRVVAAKEEK